MDPFTKILISLGSTLLVIHMSKAEPIANIGLSQVRGQSVTPQGIEVSQYLGIPYAEPPINENRFQKPVPKSFYPTVVLAYDSPASCWQAAKYPFPTYNFRSDKSEDCLYLNIWTPKSANSKNMKSVIYWIYGAGFRFGGIRQDEYFGAALAALGDVVVVTVNYRVGAFGFLTSGTDEAPGNVGLWDILEGLKWVNKNIESFGGDKSRVTIAGEDAGSLTVGLLSISPLAKELFQRQIMQSGTPATPDSNNKQINLDVTQKIAEGVKCADGNSTIYNNATAVIRCLRHANAKSISVAHSAVKPNSLATFRPQYGDELLPSSPKEAVIAKNMMCKQVLIGNVRDEGSYLITTADPDKYGFFGEKTPQFNKTSGQQTIRKIFQNFPDPDAVVRQYISSNDNLTDDQIRRQVYTSVGDAAILCPTVYFAEKCADMGADVYYYLFEQRPSDSPWAPWMGVAHASDVGSVFGMPIMNKQNYYKQEVQLSSEVIGIWSSFAKYGKPSIPWPLYSKSSPNFVHLGPGSEVGKNGTGPHRKQCDFFRPLFGF